MNSKALHIPVLLESVIKYMQPQADGVYLDGTVGAGGHSRAILESSAPTGTVLALDRDAVAIATARDHLAGFGNRVRYANTSYASMAEAAASAGISRVNGVLLDLGLSSIQLATAERGFSFMTDGPLDMRFDRNQKLTAADIVNRYSETELAGIFWRLGEERSSRRYARLIAENRPFTTTTELAGLIASNAPGKSRIHPATRVFQALRMAVNSELEILDEGLHAAVQLLTVGGRLLVISFHSLEDRLVKQFIRLMSTDCICPPEQPVCTCETNPTLKPVTRKPVTASEDEVEINPRSRSAKLRVAERLPVAAS